MPILRVPAVPSHLAPILVSVPWWTRLNRYAEQPNTHPHKPLAEDILRSRHVSDYETLPAELHRRNGAVILTTLAEARRQARLAGVAA